MMQFSKMTVPLFTQPELVQLFEAHESELDHLPSTARSPDLNIIEPLWSVLEIRVRNRFPTCNIFETT
jgi:hypothetical protein